MPRGCAGWTIRSAPSTRTDAGTSADLLILGGNPLDDVGNLTRVEAVLMGGERVV
jgi:hypothetical protein